MLEKSIFFVSKQPVLIEISDIHQVVFSRVGAGIATARTFDMQIITKHGPEYTFTSINKEEHELTDTFLKDKKVRVKNEMVPEGDLLLAAAGDDSDEEMQSVASDDDEEPRVRRTGDDDDDSEDGKSPPIPPIFSSTDAHTHAHMHIIQYIRRRRFPSVVFRRRFPDRGVKLRIGGRGRDGIRRVRRPRHDEETAEKESKGKRQGRGR